MPPKPATDDDLDADPPRYGPAAYFLAAVVLAWLAYAATWTALTLVCP